MKTKSLLNQLKLAYNPLSNYDFSILKSDSDIQKALENSCLYIITQRPELSFEKIKMNNEQETLEFEIHQKSNPNFVKIKLPIFQENLATNPNNPVVFYFGSNDPNHVFDKNNVTNVHGIKLYDTEIKRENFLIWFSPEKFLLNLIREHFIAEIEGDIHELLKYKVHYVGKSTEQDILKRLTGHKTLQEILSVEYPFIYGSLPTHEIALLLFEFKENLSIQTFDVDSSIDEMVDSYLGKNQPEQRTIFLDAEKALIKAMQPKHNKILFKKYPESDDGLNKHNFSTITYTFVDPITLQYDKDEIRGGLTYWGGDTILIKENRIELIKQ